MINTAQFRIIGRIGSVNTLDKVTHLSIANDRRAKDGDDNWTTLTKALSGCLGANRLR